MIPANIKYPLILIVLILACPSCIIYKKKPPTIEEAASPKNTYLKILRKDGIEYKLRWIEEKDGIVYSIKNTKRVDVKKTRIERYVVMMPHTVDVPLDYALAFDGPVYIDTQESSSYVKPEKFYKYKFIVMEDIGDYIRGIMMTGKDTATVYIPVDQIEKISIINKDATVGLPLLGLFGVFAGLVAIAIANMTVPVFP